MARHAQSTKQFVRPGLRTATDQSTGTGVLTGTGLPTDRLQSFLPSIVVLALLILSAACTPTRGVAPVPTTAAVTITSVAPPSQVTQTAPAQVGGSAPTTAADLSTATATQPPQPTNTTIPETATTAPTQTVIPTTAQTATPQPIALSENGLVARCLPEHMSITYLQDPGAPTTQTKDFTMQNGPLEVKNLPYSACAFLYTFNQPAPSGLKLEVYELKGKNPWLTADLQPLQNQPNGVAATLRHVYIVAPPLWNVSYQFVVRDASGNELRRDQVNLHRWTPKLCWNGRAPNPITLRCPLPLDLHPWDAGYGTPIPTFPPGE